MALPHPVSLVAVETALPQHVIPQEDAAAAAADAFRNTSADFPRVARVFETAGIRTRHAVRPLDWFREPHGWPDRTAVYREEGARLFAAAATRALAAARLDAREVDTVVTVSSTGIATPTLEALAFRDLGFREGVRRVPVFGLGCAGGTSGLGIAATLAAARPGTTVLLVVVELCTLSFRLDKPTKSNIVAAALFGDGAAACVLRAGTDGEGSPTIEAAGEHLWPDTLDVMGWHVDPEGFDVIFSRAIPPFAEERAGPAIASILARDGLGLADVDRFLFHPGGAKVIAALERSLALEEGALDHERAVLSACGNMSAPTALFVLKRQMDLGLPPRTVLSAMGPGFTLSCVTLRTAA